MNPKNTLTLALTLGLLILGLYVVRTRPGDPKTPAPPPPRGGTSTSRVVIEDSPGEVIKISVKRPDRDDWLFQKKADGNGGPVAWRMTAPQDFKAVSWEVEKLPRQLGTLMYDISYGPSDSATVNAGSAGLAPPRAIVSMSDKDGNTAVVEIGGPAGKQETYVRLEGNPRIYVGKSSLSGLFKDKAVAYREKLLWTFDENNATRLEIVDRSEGETTYVFTRDGTRWMIESPVTARATAKVQEAIAALARPRVIQWHDDIESKLPIYGLAPAAMTLSVTVEQTITVENAEPGETEETPPAPPKTETKTTVYVLHVADRSPIGEDTKAYIRTGDGPAVATIMKTTIDKVTPVMSEWRDRKITPLDVTTATSFELATPHGSLSAKNEDGSWHHADESGSLDDDAVAGLLKSIQDLSASAYVDGTETATTPFGFDQPQASISLTIPGATAPERITIGTHTSATSKLLVYVRRNDDIAIAKVRSTATAKLLQDPIAYADRTLFDLPPATIVALTVASNNTITNKRQTLRYAKNDGIWSMTAPIEMEVNQQALDQLATTLAGLRATRVVAAPSESILLGLQQPGFVVTIGYDLTLGTAAGDHAATTVSSLSLSLSLLAGLDGHNYAKRQDAATVFELDRNLLDLLAKENAKENVWSFDPETVSSFSVEGPDGSFTFNRSDERWTYAAEPDLRLDDNKVENLLLRLRDLRITRVANYNTDSLATFGLDQPAYTLSITHTDKTTSQLTVGAPTKFEGKLFASRRGTAIVLMLEENAADRFAVTIEALEHRDP